MTSMLIDNDKTTLLEIARETIETYLREARNPTFEIGSPLLKEERGAFVTLHKENRLRGCIGTFISEKSLYETVIEMSLAAAVKDPRFPPVSIDELDNIRIEISVLSPLKRIDSIEEIEVGKHGLYIIKGFDSGVLLPQVAVEKKWDRETFLTHTCLKAGINGSAWKEGVDVYIFSAEIFREQ